MANSFKPERSNALATLAGRYSHYKKALENQAEFMQVEPSDSIIPKIALNILAKMHKSRPLDERESSLNEKIEQACKKLDDKNRPLGEIIASSKDPVALFGPHIKENIDIYKEAAKMAAESIGFNFVDSPDFSSPNPKRRYKPLPTDFVFMSIEMNAWEEEPSVFKNDEKTIESDKKAMEQIISRRVNVIKAAGGGFILLESFSEGALGCQKAGGGLLDSLRKSSESSNIAVGVVDSYDATPDGTILSNPSRILLEHSVPVFVSRHPERLSLEENISDRNSMSPRR